MNNYSINETESQLDIKSIDCQALAENILGAPARKSGKAWFYNAPNRNEKTPSFAVYPDGFKDYGGDTSGDASSLIQLVYGCNFETSLDYLRDLNHLPRIEVAHNPKDTHELPLDKWQSAMFRFVEEAHKRLLKTPEALEYLYRRGLTDETINASKMGYNPNWIETGYRDEQGMVKAAPGWVIPWMVDNILYAVRIRTHDEDTHLDKYLNIRGSKPASGLFTANNIEADKPVLMLEGEFDALLAYQELGIPAVTRGSAGNHHNIPSNIKEILEQANIIVSIFDNDLAGQEASRKISDQFNNIIPLKLPVGKDFTDYIINHSGDIEIIRASIKNAIDNQSRLWWAGNVPDSWRTAGLTYCKPTEVALIELIHMAGKQGLISLSEYTVNDLMEAGHLLGFRLSKRTVRNTLEDIQSFAVQKVETYTNTLYTFCTLPLKEVKQKLLLRAKYRIFERIFGKSEALSTLQAAMLDAVQVDRINLPELSARFEDLYQQQKSTHAHEMSKAQSEYQRLEFNLDTHHSTPLPEGWTIENATDYRAWYLRGIVEDDPEDHRSRKTLCRMLGVSNGALKKTLDRAGIENLVTEIRKPVTSSIAAKQEAYNAGAYIKCIEITDTSHIVKRDNEGNPTRYAKRAYSVEDDRLNDVIKDAKSNGLAVDVILQPPAKQQTISDSQPPKAVKSLLEVDKSQQADDSIGDAVSVAPNLQKESKPIDNTRPAGNHYDASYDPQFVYWELAKAIKLLKGYIFRDDRLCDPQTGEILVINPTAQNLVDILLDRYNPDSEYSEYDLMITEWALEVGAEIEVMNE